MNIYEEFYESHYEETGLNLSPPNSASNLMGAHAMVVIGYDNLKKVFIVRNSWGCKWGNNGHCEIPYCFFDRHTP